MGAPQVQDVAADSDDLKKPAADDPPPSTLQTYLNLVQQYLAVFMVDNALWLAERCVAEYPSSSEAIYLLALCHHRNGRASAARQILEASKAKATPTSNYLLAVCCFELQEFAIAEDVLLRTCRNNYRRQETLPSSSLSAAANMDEWILSTSVGGGFPNGTGIC
jgi:hypothetical protein